MARKADLVGKTRKKSSGTVALTRLGMCETTPFEAHDTDNAAWVPKQPCGASVEVDATGVPLWLGLNNYHGCKKSDFGHTPFGAKFHGVKVKTASGVAPMLGSSSEDDDIVFDVQMGLGATFFTRAALTSYLAVQDIGGMYSSNITAQYVPFFEQVLTGGLTEKGFEELEKTFKTATDGKAMLTNIFFGAGAAILVVGLILLAVYFKGQSNKTAPSS